MALTRTRSVHPRLGIYFGIYVSAFVTLSLLTLIFEGLGTSVTYLKSLMLLGPILLYAAIGIASHTSDTFDYFASGRRVPAFYMGLGLATTALGGTGLLGLTGAFFLIGFDALCLVIGGLAGFVFMAVLLAPFFRKFGAFTVPSYLGRRFDSRGLRVVSALLLAVPAVLILAAELKTGAYAVQYLSTATSNALTATLLALVLVVTLIPGGMRSLSWSSSAQSLASLVALVVPVSVAGVMLTNFPVGQLSHGPVVRQLGRLEGAAGLPIVLPPPLAFDFPHQGLQPIAKRFADSMGAVGSLSFTLMTLTTLCGIAAAPWLLSRVAATPGVYVARKSLGWATVLFGLLMLTLASVAVFYRAYVFQMFSGAQPGLPPEWMKTLIASGLVATDIQDGPVKLLGLSFSRDGVLFGLPVAGGMPAAVTYLIAAGVLAACLAAAGSALIALANSISEDLVTGLSLEPKSDSVRLGLARAGIVAAALLGAAVATAVPADPFDLLLWALALTGSTAFPVLVLSIWWSRLNPFGALIGMVTGFGAAALAIYAGRMGMIDIHPALAGVFGLPVGAVSAVAVTAVTPSPGKQLAEFVRDIRVPGGEIIYDRELRLAQRKKT
jgi:cation/acetate symporter